MRRILLVALLGTAVVAVPTSTAEAKAKPTFKVGTYKAKAGTQEFKISLKHAKCGGRLQFCLSLPKPVMIECTTPTSVGGSIQNLAKPVALSRTGKLTDHQSISYGPPIPLAGKMTFSIAFTKKGTATGSLQIALSETFGTLVIPCSAKMRFTAKLK